MSKIDQLLLPITSFFVGFDQSAILITLLIIFFGSIIYIISTMNRLKMIFKHRDYSLRQNYFIISRIIFMFVLAYVMYEIVNLFITK